MRKHLLLITVISVLSALPTVAYNKLIQENRIWEYSTTSVSENYIQRFCFDGTEERSGKVYNVWKLMEKTIYPTSAFSAQEETIAFNTPLALLREEDDKVYMLVEGHDIRTFNTTDHILSKVETGAAGQEMLLYDFALTENEDVHAAIDLVWGEGIAKAETVLSPCTVLDIKPFSLSSGEVKFFNLSSIVNLDLVKSINGGQDLMTLIQETDQPIQLEMRGGTDNNTPGQSTISYAEIVGNTGRGTLTELQTPEDIYLTSSMYNPRTTLYAVYDTNGTIIYGTPASIPSCGEDESSKSHIIFDLHGREITTPLPGSIYIRNGKKFVGR